MKSTSTPRSSSPVSQRPTFPSPNSSGPKSKPSKSSYHAPRSVEEITKENVQTIAKLEHTAEQQQSRADFLADWITRFFGTISFVIAHAVWFAIWIVANTLVLKDRFDPFPFSLLTLIVSLEAIFLSAFILISENRKSRMDGRRNHLDLQINLLAEQENTKILGLLKQIAEKLDIDPSDDPDVSVLEQATRPEKLLEQIDAIEEKKGKIAKR